nr:tetratricopeptide repeat protein [Clostridium pascui]
MPWLTYQLGDSYKKLNDNANALVYFKKVIQNYPGSQFVSSAERMIKEIESK